MMPGIRQGLRDQQIEVGLVIDEQNIQPGRPVRQAAVSVVVVMRGPGRPNRARVCCFHVWSRSSP